MQDLGEELIDPSLLKEAPAKKINQETQVYLDVLTRLKKMLGKAKNIIWEPDYLTIGQLKQRHFAMHLSHEENVLFTARRFDLIVTDQWVYGSNDRVPLKDIYMVTRDREFGDEDVKQARVFRQLFINGEPFIKTDKQYLPDEFLTTTLEELGKTARKLHGHTANPSTTTLALMTASAIVGERNENDVKRILIACGMDKNAASEAIQIMKQTHSQIKNSARIAKAGKLIAAGVSGRNEGVNKRMMAMNKIEVRPIAGSWLQIAHPEIYSRFVNQREKYVKDSGRAVDKLGLSGNDTMMSFLKIPLIVALVVGLASAVYSLMTLRQRSNEMVEDIILGTVGFAIGFMAMLPIMIAFQSEEKFESDPGVIIRQLSGMDSLISLRITLCFLSGIIIGLVLFLKETSH